MKKHILLVAIALSSLACQSDKKEGASLLPEAEHQIKNKAVNAERLKGVEQAVGIDEYTDIISKKTWEDIDAFYQALPTKCQELKIEKEQLDIMQHNLIVSMVMYHDLLESGSDKIAYYAKEFIRLGAENQEVSAALYRSTEGRLTDADRTTLKISSGSETEARFNETKSEINKLRSNK